MVRYSLIFTVDGRPPKETLFLFPYWTSSDLKCLNTYTYFIVDIDRVQYRTLIIPKFNNIISKRACQYTKGCIFGWKMQRKIRTTKVVYDPFGCT